MTSRVLWIVAAVLFGLSLIFFVSGDGAALTDYRAWVLFALAALAAAIGNTSRSFDDHRELR